MRNIKRASVIEMSQLLTPCAGQSGYLQEEEIWGEDPVHLTSKGYSLVAAGIESLTYEKGNEEKEAEEKGGQGQGPAKKPRHDAAEHRPAWVKGSVAEAVRRGGGSEGGGGPPRPPYKQYPGWRGGYQLRGSGGASFKRGGRGGGQTAYPSNSGSGSGHSRGRGEGRGWGFRGPRRAYRGRGRPW
jgi:hypothetical protein